jgi:hypothetical protein
MAVEILEGSIEPAEPARTKGKWMMFDTLRFRGRHSGERELRKVCCAGDVASAVRKGGPGRYYLSSGGGQTGIHGVRMDDGTQAYAHYNNMEKIVLIGASAGMFMLGVGIVTGKWMITPVVIGFLLIGAYVFLRGIRIAGQRQYDGDAGR